MADAGDSLGRALDWLAGEGGVALALEAARGRVDRLLAHPVLRRRAGEVAAETALRSARASAALEGHRHPLEQVRAGTGDPVVQGALRAVAALPRLAPTLARAPLQVLARLHVLAAAGLVGEEELGRPRGAGPAQGARLAGLVELVRAPAGVPAVLVGALAEAEVLAIAPFETANGVVARAFSRLVLMARGLDPGGLCPVEVGAAVDPEGYRGVAAGYADGDAAAWVCSYAGFVTAGAEEGLAVCEAVLRRVV